MIKYHVQGNLIDLFECSDFDGIVQGCNCFHTMGAGLAGEIARRYPIAVEADKKTEYGDWSKLGDYSVASTVYGDIINGYTQFRPGKCPQDQLYANIKELFKLLNKDYAGKTLGIPLIGAGIAGGDWNKIVEIVQAQTPDVGIVIVYL